MVSSASLSGGLSFQLLVLLPWVYVLTLPQISEIFTENESSKERNAFIYDWLRRLGVQDCVFSLASTEQLVFFGLKLCQRRF